MAAVWRDYGGRRQEAGVERRRASGGLLASLRREEAFRRLPLSSFELAATCKWAWRRRHAPMLIPSEVSRQRLTEWISALPSLPLSCHPIASSLMPSEVSRQQILELRGLESQ